MPRFEFVEGTSSKFWEIEVAGAVLTTRWGRIGSAGSTKQQTFASAAAAGAARDKLVGEKTRKGYREVGAAPAAPTPAAPTPAAPTPAAPTRAGAGAISPDALVLETLRTGGGRLGRVAIWEHAAVATGEQCFASSDGKTFHRRSSPGTSYVLEAIDGAFYSAGGPYAVSHDAGATWQRLKSPIQGNVLALHRAADGTWWMGGGDGEVFQSRHAARGWKAASFSLKGKVLGFAELGGALYVVGQGGGGAWDGRKFRAFKGFTKDQVVTRITETPSGALVVIGDGGIAFRSTDRGATWKRVRTGGTYDLEDCAWVAGALFVVGALGALLRSTDDGKTFTKLEGTAHRLWAIRSWGDGALLAGDGGELHRLASREDRYWAGATDRFAPPPPTVDRELAPRPAPPPAELDRRFAQLFREATEASQAASAPLRAARPPDPEPNLAQMIDEEPGDDASASEVYADWLQRQGDPRGELAAVQLQLAADPKHKAARAAEKALFKAHGERLLGKLAPIADLVHTTWRAGFIHAARVAHTYERSSMHDGELEELDVAQVVGWLLDEPSARFLRELTVGIVTYEDNSYGPIARLIGKRYLPALRSLFLGDFDSEETELSWSQLANVEPIYAAVPNLRRLKLRSGSMRLGRIVLPRLERFEVVTGGLDPKAARAIAGARWPSLRELSIQVGTERYGGTATLADLQPILDGAGLPRLRHLGLTNLEYSDAAIAAVADSKLLPQLEELDLSLGTLSDDGARVLYRYQNAFRHLRRIDVDANFLTGEGLELLRSSPLAVHAGDQRDDEGDPDNRYVAVGE